MAARKDDLYDEDFYAWTQDQAAALRRLAGRALERRRSTSSAWPRRSRTWAASAATRS